MNDRFKFRWFSKLHKKMFEVVCLEFPNFVIYKDEQGNEVETALNSDNGDLVQCTGLKDKNGKLIYEGDIIRCYYLSMFLDGVVIWESEELGFNVEASDGEIYRFIPTGKKETVEVIGNIYENPELLEA